jgi:beta-lactamase class A
MLRNMTSDARMRAGLTPPYELADKTGGGAYGVVNDAGVLWRPDAPPITIAILTRTGDPAGAVPQAEGPMRTESSRHVS